MIVSHFLRWNESAPVRQRAAAAAALARAFVSEELEFEDRCAAEAALTLLLDDPSEKVRLALAENLSISKRAPVQIIRALATDQPSVAGVVLARSPLLSDAQLVDLLAEDDERKQVFIAMRASLSMQVCAAIAEIGTVDACIELLANSGADLATMSLRRIAERHGRHPQVRGAMLDDARLPADTRHALLVTIGETLRHSSFVRAAIGERRADKITRDACVHASLTLVENADAGDHAAMVEHLRLRGELTTSFLMRVVGHGNIDFFGCAIVSLSGQSGERVRGLLARGGPSALRATLSAAGLPAICTRPILRALDLWRDVANGRRIAGPQEVTFEMRRAIEDGTGAAELATLLDQIHLDMLRRNARSHALTIAAA
ncbi:MAG: DUF2336 domain-containing protein [Rhizobiaceae bacterium]|nr:DUF2336 domain-containing protein [Rhizobiaceae bacterium]MCV0406402.1 DUF2336 domain-containing protein [Rhizobiaceae bacterium]